MAAVVLITTDGLRPELVGDPRYPNLTAFRSKSAWSLSASSVYPSKTLPAHVSIFHSVPPSRHGIFENEWKPISPPIPSLVDLAPIGSTPFDPKTKKALLQNNQPPKLLKNMGLRSAFFYDWEPLRDLARPGSLTYSFFRNYHAHPNGIETADQVVAEEAVRYINSEKPDFAFVYFVLVDYAGHVHGWMSDGYLEQVGRLDDAVGTLIDQLPTDVTVLIESDHGGHDRIHGTDLPEDMTIPWMVSGPGIKKNYEITSPVSLLDTAPTLARILSLTPHPNWEGRCIEEIFE
jgi:predicted AlkP superfamily pyrophosphatase or phosphodiesterase